MEIHFQPSRYLNHQPPEPKEQAWYRRCKEERYMNKNDPCLR